MSNYDHFVVDPLFLVNSFCTYCEIGKVVDAKGDPGRDDVNDKKNFKMLGEESASLMISKGF